MSEFSSDELFRLDEIEKLRAEIERLTTDLSDFRNAAADEILHLKNELGGALVRENNLLAENAKLRAALERLDRQRQISERDGTPVPHWAIVEACSHTPARNMNMMSRAALTNEQEGK